ncbi:MAG TPA: hypothetical protein VFG73_08470 [Rhodanobacteraceae bacterium]|nr:hypothetical protein [Rhodanobacteraceae bacterium]
MRLITRIIALSRSVQLGRQLAEVERAINSLNPATRARLTGLTLRELELAAQCEFPHLYATPPEQRYRAWGSGTDIGFARARSDNLQVRLRGIALWLAVAFHETRDASFSEPQNVHRRILGILRLLKQSAPAVVEKQEEAGRAA